MATDYCDVCGEPIGASAGAVAADPPAGNAASPTPPPPAPASGTATTSESPVPLGPEVVCPNCHSDNPGGSLFCEDCGYDFTTRQVPTPPTNQLSLDPSGSDPIAAATSAAPVGGAEAAHAAGWVAEVWVDPDWYAVHGVDLGDPCPPASTPNIARLPAGITLIGRTSKSRGVTPGIDCGTDSAVSHRHAQLTNDRDRWFIEDLDSTNGTYVSVVGAPLPDTALVARSRRELLANERIQLGAWTRIVVRTALPGE